MIYNNMLLMDSIIAITNLTMFLVIVNFDFFKISRQY